MSERNYPIRGDRGKSVNFADVAQVSRILRLGLSLLMINKQLLALWHRRLRHHLITNLVQLRVNSVNIPTLLVELFGLYGILSA